MSSATADANSKIKTLFSKLLGSRIALLVTAGVVALAVIGGTFGYFRMGTTVTLAVDGEEREVRVVGDTVADVLEAESIELTDRDLVQPAPDADIEEGSRISVRYSRPVELTIDGKTETHWVTALDVEEALTQIGREYRSAELSLSRGTEIDRSGIDLDVVTPKKLTLSLAGKKPVTEQIAALTVGEALAAAGVRLDKHDIVKPALDTRVADGDKIKWTDIKIVRKVVKNESYDVETITREDPEEYEGTETTVRESEPGTRNATYKLVYRNGELVTKDMVRQRILEKAVAGIVAVGTKEEPAPNYAGGDTVWDRLAQCESGGNWAANTGNGYYGGLQFSLSTWHAVGGSGYPHQASREEQIHRGQILQSRAGWGQWPVCAAQLGLI